MLEKLYQFLVSTGFFALFSAILYVIIVGVVRDEVNNARKERNKIIDDLKMIYSLAARNIYPENSYSRSVAKSKITRTLVESGRDWPKKITTAVDVLQEDENADPASWRSLANIAKREIKLARLRNLIPF